MRYLLLLLLPLTLMGGCATTKAITTRSVGSTPDAEWILIAPSGGKGRKLYRCFNEQVGERICLDVTGEALPPSFVYAP